MESRLHDRRNRIGEAMLKPAIMRFMTLKVLIEMRDQMHRPSSRPRVRVDAQGCKTQAVQGQSLQKISVVLLSG